MNKLEDIEDFDHKNLDTNLSRQSLQWNRFLGDRFKDLIVLFFINNHVKSSIQLDITGTISIFIKN